MKKLISCISLLAIVITGFAQSRIVYNRDYSSRKNYNYRPMNALVIDTRGQRDFTVIIDNGAQYKSNGGAVTVNSLSNGYHRVMIYENRNGFFRMGKEREHTVFNSTVRLRPGMETTLFVERNGQPEITEKALYNNDNKWNDRRYNHSEIRN